MEDFFFSKTMWETRMFFHIFPTEICTILIQYIRTEQLPTEKKPDGLHVFLPYTKRSRELGNSGEGSFFFFWGGGGKGKCGKPPFSAFPTILYSHDSDNNYRLLRKSDNLYHLLFPFTNSFRVRNSGKESFKNIFGKKNPAFPTFCTIAPHISIKPSPPPPKKKKKH